MKVDLFSIGLNVDEEGNSTPIVHFNPELEKFADLETLKKALGEEDTIKISEIAVNFLNKLKGFN